MLRRQRAIEIVPSGKPLRWRRYDVPQHLAPETSDALRFCAVEGDLELLDRSHRSTIEARRGHRRQDRISTYPSVPCTRIRWPSAISRVASTTPTTAGKPYSRAITAPWVIR